MQLFGLKTCDTCRKALKKLPNAQFIDVRTEGVPQHILDRAFEQFGNGFLNTRSTTWRGLSEEERQIEPMDLLKEHPTLMKRPLIADGENLFLGWTPEVQDALS